MSGGPPGFARLRAGGFMWQVRAEWLDDRLRALLADPEHPLTPSAGAVRPGRLAFVGGLLVKRYRAVQGMRRVKSALSLSRAGRAWRMAHALERAGVATPRAVAVTGTGWWPGRRPSFLVTEEIPGAVTLDAWRGPRVEAARRLGELVARLHAGGFSHPDLNAGNLVLDPAGRPWLVDLDTARRLGPTSRLRAVGRFHAVGDLARLARRVAVFPGITRTDRLRFLQRYAEVSGDGDWRRWWRLIALRAEAAQARRARRTARA